MRDIVILGSTGSIGTQALDIVRANPGRFKVIGLAAGGANPQLIAEQAVEFECSAVAVHDVAQAAVVREVISSRVRSTSTDARGAASAAGIDVTAGPDAVAALAGLPCDVVLNGITGSIGLAPTLAALSAGSTVALANKESLVIGGRLVTSRAATGQLVPVDSEHSALAQCLRAGRAEEVDRLILTASGGPFRGRTRDDLQSVTPTDALAHPTWSMGPVVTINSATMVNKGLELIEAHLLFDIPLEAIDTVVHPQSIVHSMVQFRDGSIIAQASPPDMHLPIALGLGWPDRIDSAATPCDFTAAQAWTFEPIDHEAFPAVGLARFVGAAAGTAPAVYNAANEVCVEAFISGRLQFTDIVATVGAVVDRHLSARSAGSGPFGHHHVADADLSLEAVLAADSWARQEAHALLDD